MYCPNAPQRLRCCDICWAAVRSSRDHVNFCGNKAFVSSVLDEFDDAHSCINRLMIELEWIRGESVLFDGPKTMFCGVFVITREMILLRIDVWFDSSKITAVDEHINHSSELKRFQVAALLAIKRNPSSFI